MRQCDKCRKMIPKKDMERHIETCQKLFVHTSQNAQAPKIIEFQTLESGKQMSNHTTNVTKKQRITSAKPPLRVGNKEDNRLVKGQNVPKWK